MKPNERSSINSFIGFSAPETPKLLVLNNFLSDFFPYQESNTKKYSFDDFKELIVCEEGDAEKKKQLIDSFNYYFSTFSGENLLSKKTTKIYFPLHKNMLVPGDYTLRHLLYQLYINGSAYSSDTQEIENKLKDYLYCNSVGTNRILSFLCEHIASSTLRMPGVTKENLRGEQWFIDLAKKFVRDLNTVVTSDNYRLFDYYRKADYLATLLSFYVVLYFIERTNIVERHKKGVKTVILCKGSANSTVDNKELHRLAVKNFAGIRERIVSLYSKYLKSHLSSESGVEQKVTFIRKDDGIHYSFPEGDISSFEDFVEQKMGIRMKNMNRNEKLIKILGLEDKESSTLSIESFVMKFTSFLKNRSGSYLIKLMSTLSSTGRDIDFVFPRNRSKHKFFAMSEQMADFFVRLFLSCNDTTFADYDSFVDWLEDEYNICVRKSKKLDGYLGYIHSTISTKAYHQNELDFIDTLTRINALLKISDSGYIIILPEHKGGFNLL